jgi:hypothetical protein
MPLDRLHISLQAVGDVQCLPIRSSEAAIREVDARRSADDPRLVHAIRVDSEYRAKTRMTHEEAALLVDGKTVGTYVPEGLKEHANF